MKNKASNSATRIAVFDIINVSRDAEAVTDIRQSIG
jgi:hypothetical protein